MTVDLVPFEPEHVTQIHLRDDEGVSPQYRDKIYEWAKCCQGAGPSFTAVDEGKVICCAGMRVIKEGVAEAWMVLSKEGTGMKYRVPLYTQVSHYMARIMKDLDLHRVQAWVRIDFPAGARYVEALGFVREGVMKQYDIDRTDCYLYAFTKEKQNGH